MPWRGIHLVSLCGVGLVIAVAGKSQQVFGDVQLRPGALALAGLAVGFGTRLGNGCTSGHGLCGLPRLSPRSLAAVLSFMGVGAATAMLARNVGPLRDLLYGAAPLALSDLLPAAASTWASEVSGSKVPVVAIAAAGVCIAIPVLRRLLHGRTHTAALHEPHTSAAHAARRARKHAGEVALAVAAGGTFGLGLAVSGMTSPSVVQAFLDPIGAGGWNPTLAFVMGSGVAINLVAFLWASRHHGHAPLQLEPEGKHLRECIAVGAVPANTKIDAQLLTGAAIFGFGWGLGGICPGPGLVAFGAGHPAAVVFVPTMVLGMAALEACRRFGWLGLGHAQTVCARAAAGSAAAATSASDAASHTTHAHPAPACAAAPDFASAPLLHSDADDLSRPLYTSGAAALPSKPAADADAAADAHAASERRGSAASPLDAAGMRDRKRLSPAPGAGAAPAGRF